MQNLREDKAYTYGCRSALNIDEFGSIFYAYGNFRNDVLTVRSLKFFTKSQRSQKVM